MVLFAIGCYVFLFYSRTYVYEDICSTHSHRQQVCVSLLTQWRAPFEKCKKKKKKIWAVHGGHPIGQIGWEINGTHMVHKTSTVTFTSMCSQHCWSLDSFKFSGCTWTWTHDQTYNKPTNADTQSMKWPLDWIQCNVCLMSSPDLHPITFKYL